MSETNQGIDVEALAALVKSQAAVIEQLQSKLQMQEVAAQPKLIDINDVRAQPDPKFRGMSLVYRQATPQTDPTHLAPDGTEFRIVKSPAERAQAITREGWKGYAHEVFAVEPDSTEPEITEPVSTGRRDRVKKEAA